MGVDERSLAGVRLKLRRAHEQLESLEGEIQAFLQGEGYTTRLETNETCTQYVWRFQIAKPIPVVWDVLVGEAIHNLRSALDNSVYALAVDNGHSSPHGTGFPIFDDAADFAKYGASRIKKVGPGPRAFIEGLQPYPDRNPARSHLITLNRYSNWDKHRLVHRWGMYLKSNSLGIENITGPYQLRLCRDLLDHGAEVARATFAASEPHMRVTGAFEFGMARLDPADAAKTGGQNESLWSVWDFTAGVVGILLGSIERQTQPSLWPDML